MQAAPKCQQGGGFTLVELLVVIAVIGIMSALILSVVGNAAQDSRNVVARQQQVVLQEALNAWIVSPYNSNNLTVARTRYTAASNMTAKLALLQGHLSADTYSHLTEFSTGTKVQSDALQRAGHYLTFSAWTTNNTPTVEMN